MQPARRDDQPGLKSGLALFASIHLDALRLAPRAYLEAWWWRVNGKRLRARARFAPLLGASPRAYRLWLCGESRAGAQSAQSPQSAQAPAVQTVPIILLVDPGEGGAALAATLASAAR
ncbi:hypothetical protein MTR62_19645, partial [Novosphingobium sp. 1949]|nr:hypothetical protein [Novosphingobium organovorum]